MQPCVCLWVCSARVPCTGCVLAPVGLLENLNDPSVRLPMMLIAHFQSWLSSLKSLYSGEVLECGQSKLPI